MAAGNEGCSGRWQAQVRLMGNISCSAQLVPRVREGKRGGRCEEKLAGARSRRSLSASQSSRELELHPRQKCILRRSF